jgi:hypothetical protein
MEFHTWALGYLRSHKDADICKPLSGCDFILVLSVIELMEAAWHASMSNMDTGKYVSQLDDMLTKQ